MGPDRIVGCHDYDSPEGASFQHHRRSHQSHGGLVRSDRARGIDPYDTSDHVTGDDWLDTHRAAQADDDQHREIHPDVADEHDDTRTDGPDPRERQPIREVDQTAEMVARAQETLRMIEERRAAEVEQAAHEASRVAEEEARATQLTQWSREDNQKATDTVEVDDGQALER